MINRPVTINGNGCTIDGKGKANIFQIPICGVVLDNINFINAYTSRRGGAVCFTDFGNVSGNVTNCNFVNNIADGYGGAISFYYGEGYVTNCNFTNNSACGGHGGAIDIYSGSVENCNFVDNHASVGGDIFIGYGSVENCNFTSNSVSYTGGAVHVSEGTVNHCNFVNNIAVSFGGAVYADCGNVTSSNFVNNSAGYSGGAISIDCGSVENCIFVNNSASVNGGAIYDIDGETTANTCVFKTDSDTTYRIQFISPTLIVDDFDTVYNSGEKLTFDFKTNSGISVSNVNISISVYFYDDWVGNYSCLSGEGWIPYLPSGHYYAIFNTEYEAFQPVKKMITVGMPKTWLYINVTSFTTHNKTVNITAQSNIPYNLKYGGRIVFILPNNEIITAKGVGNGTWWATYTFDDYGDYEVNVRYESYRLYDLNKGTISISKTPTEITVENETVDLFVPDSLDTDDELTPAGAGNLTFTSSNESVAKVENGQIIAVGERYCKNYCQF